MSIGSVDMVEEIVPYLGLDQPYLISFLCGGALDAPQLAARGCAAAVSLYSRRAPCRSCVGSRSFLCAQLPGPWQVEGS